MSYRRDTLPVQQPQAPRIKRKPPPSIDLEVRYPSPDPGDPFAPLWVLRNRYSNPSLSLIPSNDNLQSLNRKASYDLYPSILPFTVTRGKDFDVPVEVLSNDKGSHYRRRSHSTPLTQLVPSLTFPSIQSSPLIFSRSERPALTQVPSLLTDNTSDSGSTNITGTDTEAMSTPSIASTESTPGKIARLLLPKRSPCSSPNVEKHKIGVPKRVGKVSISSPMTFEHLASSGRQLNDQAARSVNDLHSPQPDYFTPLRRTSTSDSPSPPRELDGYHSQPEILPHHRARSPLSITHAVDLLVPPPSAASHGSSSYVHVPFPPSSTAHSVSCDSFARPRTTPVLHTSSSCLPSLQGHSRRHSKSGVAHSQLPPELPTQTEWAKPTISQLAYAASLPVITESGLRIAFGSLFATQRAVVIFIRHFWCPLCQDYMTSLTSIAHPDMMYTTPPYSPSPLSGGANSEKAKKVQLVVISNGSHAFLPKYRQVFGMPFSMYTDPSLALYQALGMGRDGRRVPSVASMHGHGRRTEAVVQHDEKEMMLDGGYVQHGLVSGIAMVIGRALKTAMPVWEKGGDLAQLGGEFIFGPGISCTYAHRMQSARGHVPIRDVLKAAGVNPRSPEPGMSAKSTSDSHVSALRGMEAVSQNRSKKRRNTMQDLGAILTGRKQSVDSGAMTQGSRQSLARMSSQEVEGMEGRTKSLDNLRQKKDFRRAFIGEFCLNGTGPCAPVNEEGMT